jgi:hypothetical protein
MASTDEAADRRMTMLEMFREGGFPMWVILALGLVSLAAGLRAVMKPSERRIVSLQHFSGATLYATLVGLTAALGAVFHHAPGFAEEHGLPVQAAVLQGLGESMSPVIMGFTFLAIAAVFRAVAERRFVTA